MKQYAYILDADDSFDDVCALERDYPNLSFVTQIIITGEDSDMEKFVVDVGAAVEDLMEV
jgi:hypothetical protein